MTNVEKKIPVISSICVTYKGSNFSFVPNSFCRFDALRYDEHHLQLERLKRVRIY